MGVIYHYICYMEKYEYGGEYYSYIPLSDIHTGV